MCTLVILRRPEHDWPVIIGANRDEMIDRPWQPPGRHWPDRPEVVAGLDTLAGGSWLGINDWGVAAAVLNRHGSLGPAPDRRSGSAPSPASSAPPSSGPSSTSTTSAPKSAARSAAAMPATPPPITSTSAWRRRYSVCHSRSACFFGSLPRPAA